MHIKYIKLYITKKLYNTKSIQKDAYYSRRLFLAHILSISYYLLTFIVTTCRANTMRHLRFVALWACYITRSFQFPISTTAIATAFRQSTLRYCHYLHLLSTIIRTIYHLSHQAKHVTLQIEDPPQRIHKNKVKHLNLLRNERTILCNHPDITLERAH